MLKKGHPNEPVGPAEFRIEKLQFDRVFRGLGVFLSKLASLEKRMKIQNSWDSLRCKLEGLPRRSENLERMKITCFPKQKEVDVVLPTHLQSSEEPNELRGELYPEDAVVDKDIETEASVGMDLCVYSEEIRGRPWVGRIVQILPHKRFKLQWFGRKTSRSRVFRALTNPADGSPWISELEYETVMFWMLSEPSSRTENSFSVSTLWLETINREYLEHDRM